MKKTLLTALLILLPFSSHAWNSADHQLMSRLALEDVSHDWGLDQAIEVRSLGIFLKKLSTTRVELGNAKNFSNYLRINPKIDLSHEDPAVVGQSSLTPLEILSLYSTDPDDGRDQDLPLISPDQKWFGSPSGPDSQAFRHIEKTPFDLRHPWNTFGFPFRALGEATQRAEIYYQLSLLAFSLEEDYWGWRFLAGSFHYLEDLHQPYHSGQITPGLLARGLIAYITWGHKKLGFMGTFSHLVSNSHRFYESYVANPEPALLHFKEYIITFLGGSTTVDVESSIKALAIHVRDDSNGFFSKLVCAVTRTTSAVLRGPYRYKSDEQGADDPQKFLKDGPEAKIARLKIFEITKDQFQSAGRVMRTVVRKSLQERTQKPSEILQRIDQFLPELSSHEAPFLLTLPSTGANESHR